MATKMANLWVILVTLSTLTRVCSGFTFIDQVRFADVNEESNINTPVTTITYMSVTSTPTLKIIGGNENETFIFGPAGQNSIELFVNKRIDYETIQPKQYRLTVTGNNTDGLHATHVVVTVNNINDNPPEFSNTSYALKISEKSIPGQPLYQMSATDRDGDDLTYELDSVEPFYINAKTGVVSINVNSSGSYNFETSNQFTLNIRAKDDIFTSTDVQLNIEVVDVNDNSFVFTTVPSNISIEENIQLNAPIPNVIIGGDADFSDSNSQPFFYLLNEENRKYFSLLNGGTVALLRPIAPIDYETHKQFFLTVCATDNATDVNNGPTQSTAEARSSCASIIVNVRNLNDNPPVMKQYVDSSIVLEISEKTPNGSIIFVFEATDADGDDVTFTFADGTDNDTKSQFYIPNNQNVLLKTNLELDFEKRSTYSFTIVPNDGVNNGTGVNVTILVMDVNNNNNSPLFPQQKYQFSVDENTEVNATIGNITATDLDKNDQIFYYILSNQFSSILKIEALNSSGAMLRVNGNIDAEKQSEIQVTVCAVDKNLTINNSSNEARRDCTLVIITVKDVNDNAPQFSDKQISLTISDVVIPGQVLYKVQATDNDITEDSTNILYNFKSGDTMSEISGPFQIEVSTGLITFTNSVTNASLNPQYQLTVVPFNTGILNNTGEPALITINVVKVTPVLSNDSYIFEILENKPANTIVGSLNVSNSNMEYSIYNINFSSNVFSVNNSNGLIMTNVELDREDIAQYNFVVCSKIRTNISMYVSPQDCALVTVNVLDENDNVPEILGPSPIMLKVSEALPLGTEVFTFSAIDRDTGKINSGIKFTLPSNLLNFPFALNETNGVLTLNGSIDADATTPFYAAGIAAFEEANPLNKSIDKPVLVTAIDANDNSPEFTNTSYKFEIFNTATLNSVVGQINATDRDVTQLYKDLSYYITVPSNKNRFRVNSTTGEIYVNENLANSVGVYTLMFTATDMAGQLDANDRRKTSVLVTITVKCPNATQTNCTTNPVYPTISPSSYVITITEKHSQNTPVFQFYATNPNKQEIEFEYNRSLSSNPDQNYFNLAVDGTVKLAFTLDAETSQENYTLYVRGKEKAGGQLYTNEAMLTIIIKDVNDRSPVFAKATYQFNLMEDALDNVNMATVGEVSAFDTDRDQENRQVFFELASNPYGNLFVVDPNDGTISVLSNSNGLDRETQATYILSVIATDRATDTEETIASLEVRQSSVTVIINLIDVNDNDPVLTNNYTTVNISEKFPVGGIVYQFSANDADEGENGRFRYEVIGRLNDVFDFDQATGILRTKDSLDYETDTSYSVLVQARDYGNMSRNSSISNLTIYVHDVNDNNPIFNKLQYSVSLPESTQPGFNIINMTAFDRDVSAVFSNALFTFFDPSNSNQFTFNPDGTVYLKSQLDRETRDRYQILVVARDLSFNEANPREASALLFVDVGDENDNDPVVVRPSGNKMIELQISELSPINTLVYHVSAVDSDLNDPIKYIKTNPMGNEWDHFTLDENTGEIRVNVSLSCQERCTYKLNFTAEDSKIPSGKDFGEVSITLVPATNRNGTNLYFLQSLYQKELNEDYNPAANVLMTTAYHNGQLVPNISYSIVTNDDGIRNLFYVNDSGWIGLRQKLDFEQRDIYFFEIYANDTSGVYTGAKTAIIFEIKDVNDFTPILSVSMNKVYINENALAGTIVATLHVRDEDSFTKNSNEITYNMQGGTNVQVIKISETTAFVILTTKFDAEQTEEISFNVSVKDTANLTSNIETIKLIIEDVNDVNPMFLAMKCMFEIQENNNPATYIGFVNATDGDRTSPNNEVTYSVLQGSNFSLSINSQTGVISLNESLDYEKTKEIGFTVIATDNALLAPIRRSTAVNCKIMITNLNDENPVWLNTNNITITENTRIGTEIFRVSAVDPDGNPTITYALSNLEKVPFNVTQDGTITVSGKLDYELRPTYQLNVSTVQDGIMTSQILIYVNLINVNDNRPYFLGSPYKEIVPEDLPVNSNITQVLAKKSVSEDNTVRYALRNYFQNISVSNTPYPIEHPFTINETTGVITNIRSLDHDVIPYYEIPVVAFCTEQPSLIGITIVTVNVTDVNDEKPFFDETPYNITISDNKLIGERVLKVRTTDRDSEPNSRVRYILETPNVPFELNPTTGEITVSSSLRDDGRTFYHLQIVANNNPQFESSDVFIYIERGQETGTGNNTIKIPTKVSYVSIPESEAVTGYEFDLNNGFACFDQPDVNFTLNTVDSNIFGINQNKRVYLLQNLDFETNKTNYVFTRTGHQNQTQCGIEAIHVEITDSNDNFPEFLNLKRTVNVSESTDIGQVITVIQAKDLDERSNGKLIFSIIDSQSIFGITSSPYNTAVIYLASNVDTETSPFHRLNISVTDQEGKSSQNNMIIDINILDENDFSPIFFKVKYMFRKAEGPYSNPFIGEVSAGDNDFTSLRKSFKFRIAGDVQNIFSINPENGTIIQLQQLDREQKSNYTFVVEAYNTDDSLRIGFTIVEVLVTDINDNPPVCLDQITYIYNENKLLGSLLFNIQCSDADTHEMTTWSYNLLSIMPPIATSGQGVRVDNDGAVFITQTLDYEMAKQHQIHISVGDSKFLVNLTFYINVTDVNDNRPRFLQRPSTYIQYSINENLPAGQVLNTEGLSAPDIDDGENGRVTFSIVPFSDSLLFIVNSTTGIITSTAPIDYEKNQMYQFIVNASDHGTPPRTDTMLISVNVLDLNDNPPNFTQSYYEITILDSTEIGYHIVTVLATDADSEINANNKIIYALKTPTDLVEVDRDTGTVTLKTNASVGVYQIEIIAYNNFPNSSLIDTAILDLNVVQLTPISATKIIVTTYTTIQLRENSPNGPIEISRSGTGRQNYSIEYDGNLSARKFYVTQSGDLLLNGTLDYEQEKQIHFAIISENSNTQFVDHVLVEILDENDNLPMWNVTDPYSVLINRDTDVGQIIAVISGSDVDTVSRGKLVYTLLNDANGQFKIETLNDIGFVTLNSEPLLLDSYNLSVSLNDGSNDATPNIIRLNVQVMSDIVPTFSPSIYHLQVEENTQNVFIGSVTAEAVGVALSYSIDHTASIDNVASLFSLDSNNGSIFVISTLDREQKADYSFIVKATSVISQEFAIASVKVTVLDRNDKSPVFISPMIFSVSESLPENSYLFGVRATDQDIGNNGEIRYSIISIEPPIIIQINETTGDIMYKSGLNYDVSPIHTIQVLATDQGSTTRETATNITLNVIDNNESKIEFTKAVYQNSIYENATFETLVLDVAVTGVPPNDVEYSIMHSFQDFPFFIIPTGRIFVGGSLNYEQRKDYTFPVIATYKNDRTKQAVALVNIIVLNINDNVPKFIQRTYNLILPESIPEGNEVATVFATDADMDTIYYHITSGNIQEKFRVDAQSGKIYTQSTFNYSNPFERSYEINVTATNSPAIPISTNGFDQITVFITITHIVEEPVSYFTEQFVLITLYENQSTNTPFYTPIISNNSCGNLMFSILYSMNKTDINKFTIDQSSGALRITESLNYEEKRFHHFTIQAQCGNSFPSIQSVEILVMDINDNRPYCRDNKTITVHENTMIGSEISFVRGGDNDAINSNDLVFEIESNISPFSILDNENIGIIYLERTLNDTQTSSFQLIISVSDKLENGQIASTSFSKCLVTIAVDRSEKMPLSITFGKLYYHFIEKENEPEGTIIGNITATVNTNTGALIQYNIVETEAAMSFNITQDGRLNLLKELDYEMKIQYVFQVRAYNAELNVEGYVVIIVDVLNVNDNPPTLDLPVTLTLPENMPINTLIYQINAQDPDQIGSLQFRIESVQPPINIRLQETTGGVYLDGSLDYESAQQHTAAVFVRETVTPNNIKFGEIIINVLNVNEYSPEFESPNTLLITLDENRESGFVISNPATDRDTGAFGMVYYKIIHFDDALFNVTANGDIELIGQLNYEEQKSHYFIIEASDGGIPPRRNVRPVSVMVNDINDNSPTFEINTYNISIPLSIDLGVPILKLSATDLDSGTNGMITYSLAQEGNIGTTFRIDPNTGELSVNQKRVLGELKSFILQVRTQDRNGNNPRDGETATIYVTFYEPNRQQPLFSVLYQELSVHENQPRQRIGQSAAVNSNNNIMYTIVTGTGNVENINDLFMIDSNNGSIFTKITFDRENGSSFYSFLVAAQYTDNNILKGYQSILVNILDRNDNAPKFLGPTNQTITISSAMRSNHPIALLHIYDDDLIGNFSMRLVNNPQNIFDLQFVNNIGYLHIQNYDGLKSYDNLTIEVVASDSIFESSAFVHINIVDENIKIPLCEFASPFYEINVTENTRNDTNLGNIMVKTTNFDNVTYSLYSENDYFSINQGSGALKVSGKQLDYEMKRVHFFPIVATCSSSSLKVTLTAYTSVQINIFDINDERPEFIKPVNGTIAENSPSGSIVLVLQATDKDSGDNGKITYKISGEVPNLPFSINPVTGILRVSGPIDYEEQQIYRFPVIAENLGIRVFENVEIVVLDTNDNHPKFETQFYSLSVTEEMGQQQLECFDVADRDSGKNAEISYSIFSNNTAVRENFYINSSGCLFTNKSLDREERSNYAFIVMVKDNGTPYLTQTAEIIVDVIDANDETPAFAAPMYQIRITENTLINTTVFAAEAVDRDKGTNGAITYNITAGNTGSVFEITDEGDVYTVKLLNATISPYNLTITATDKGTPDSKESTLTLKIEIVEQSVNMPCYPDFKHSSYLAVIDENDQASGIAIVEAECINNPNAIIRYEITATSLNSEGKFEIDKATGVISVATNQTIDYEVAQTHTLLIKAYEQTSPESFSSIIVRVRVNNVNDNAPEFIRLYIPIFLARDSKKDTVIATVHATDKDNTDISYRFSQQSNLFGVNNSTGDITLLRTITFDDIKNYRFFMIASDSTFESDRATIEIKIYPDNMHKPEFSAFSKIVTFTENENAGSLVYDVDATDKDRNLPSEVIDNRPESDNFGKVSYHLLNTTAKDYFSISPDFGQIRNTEVIDREIHSSFELLVEIRDGGSPPRIAVESMIVNILDENDEDPVFDISTFVFSISENSQIGSSITTIRAKDGDTGSNAQLEYAIVSGNVDNKFKIDENSGIITVNGSLKNTSQQVYVLEIFVKDSTDDPRSNSVNITINVIKVNGETPIFDVPVYEYYVLEESDVVLGTVSASTSNKNDLITYSIKRGNDSNHFTIDPVTSDSGTQLSFSNGDYEMQREYYVVIEAFIGSYSDVAFVRVIMIDINDNVPVFENKMTEVNISENANIGSTVAVLRATDEDDKNNGMVIFKMETNSSLFSISPYTGEIRVTGDLDYEEKPFYMLNITLMDSGDPPLVSKEDAVVKITIIDENDNNPTFDKSFDSIKIFKNRSEGVLYSVAFTDKDSGSNGEIMYSMTDYSTMTYFSINSSTGSISLVDSLQNAAVSSFRLNVIASDKGMPPRQGIFNLRIDIVDPLSPSPVFYPTTYNIEINENRLKDSLIVKLNVLNVDVNKNNLTFEIISGDDGNYFSVNSKGELLLKKNISEEVLMFKITVAVKNNDNDKEGTNEAVVNIKIRDINNNNPLFSQSSYSFDIEETASAGDEVGRISASDSDDGSQIIYSLSDTENTFRINQNGFIILNSTVNAFERDEYRFVGYASDNDNIERISSVPITVIIADVNESPMFSPATYNVTVSELLDINSYIISVSVQDNDLGDNGNFTLSIESGNTNDTFKLYENRLLLNKSLNYESIDLYQLIVTASDNGIPPLSSSANITIHVANKNEHRPIFSNNSYIITINETQFDTTLIHVSANDADNNANITYSIEEGLDSHYFTINSNTGEIRNSRFDISLKTVFSVSIKATDQRYPKDFSRAILTVTVLDVNDNPPVFTQTAYVFNISDTTPIGTTIGKVEATDADVTIFGNVNYSLNTSGIPFALAENYIILTGKVDFTKAPSYDFKIIATDSGGKDQGSLNASTDVTVNIETTKGTAPQFLRELYHVSVYSNVTSSKIIIYVKAIDNDGNGFNNITYSIYHDSSSKFKIDSNSGAISLQDEERLEPNPYKYKIILHVNATDDIGLYDNAYVAITILPINGNNSPIFNPMEYDVTIHNRTTLGTTILRVFASDPDGTPVLYNISAGNEESLFGINNMTGEISLKESPQDPQRKIYRLGVSATDDSGNGYKTEIDAKVIINVIYLSLNVLCELAPKFSQGSYYVSLNENSKEMRILNVSASGYSKIDYSIISSIPAIKDSFTIDMSNGEISTVKELNFESQSVYQFQVRADDTNLNLHNFAVVVVNVTDINEAPIFVKGDIEISITQLASKGHFVALVEVTDQDKNKNGEIAFSFDPASMSETFNIDPNGLITLKSKLKDTDSPYEFKLIAVDGGGLSANISVRINLINETVPEFTNRTFSFTMNESMMANINIGSLSTVAINVPIRYRVSVDKSNSPFSVNNINGTISSTMAIDYEKDPQQYSICVDVYLASDPSIYDTAVVNIKIDDINDNSPKFNRLSYNVIIPSEVYQGYVITQVFATDSDELFGKITYKIIDGNKNNNFDINETSGDIKIDNPMFAYNNYSLIIEAEDSGGLKSETNPTIFIQIKTDDKNASPKFTNKIFRFIVNESQTANFNIGSLTVLSIASPVKFRIQDNNYTGPFSLNETDGTISTKQAIDYETDPNQYSFCVEVLLVSNPSMYDTAVVNIKINDRNDNKPKFSRSLYSVIIPTDVNVGYVVVKVDATDADELFGKITYKIIGRNSNNFVINETNGEIMVNNVDFTQDNYNLIIEAADNDALTSESNATVSIEIKNFAQDIEFAFDNSSYLLTRTKILANETLSLIISGTVEPPEVLITYMLKDTSNNFVILENGAIRAVNTINSSQKFCVVAKNSENGKILDVAEVEIIIINNSTLVSLINFIPTVPRISQNTMVGSIIAVANAGNFNNAITYTLSGGDDFFIIDAGVVTLNRSLKVENLITPITLTITASDGYFNKSADLVIDIIKENIYNPKLFLNNITINPNESEIINVTLGVSDPDGDMLVYNIIGEEARNYFYITADGRLISNETLDYENKTKHEFCIEIRDSNSDNARAVILPVSISVKNIPDSAPIFPSPPYRVQVPFNWPPNIELITVTAIDPEGQTLTYGLEKNLTYFKIDPNTAVITLDKRLNGSGEFIVTVIANNGLKTTIQNVTLTFDPIRELDTVFSQVQFSSITETSLAVEMNVTEHFGAENYTKITKIYVYNQEYGIDIPDIRERSLSEPVSYFNAFNREEDRGKRYLVATVTRSPSRRKRRDVDFTDTAGIIKLIVGNEACGNKYDASVPCNGPLKPGKQYRLQLEADIPDGRIASGFTEATRTGTAGTSIGLFAVSNYTFNIYYMIALALMGLLLCLAVWVIGMILLYKYDTPEFVRERRNTMLPPAIGDTRSRVKDQPDYPFSSAKRYTNPVYGGDNESINSSYHLNRARAQPTRPAQVLPPAQVLARPQEDRTIEEPTTNTFAGSRISETQELELDMNRSPQQQRIMLRGANEEGIIAGSPRNFANPGYADDEERRPVYHATVIPSTTTVPDPPPPPPPPVSNVTSPGDNTRSGGTNRSTNQPRLRRTSSGRVIVQHFAVGQSHS